MALTISRVHDPVLSSGQAAVYDVLCDANYPAGGYAITPSMFGRRDIHYLHAQQKGVGTRIVEFDAGGAAGESGFGKLVIFTALGTPAAGGSDQSAITVRCLVLGPQA